MYVFDIVDVYSLRTFHPLRWSALERETHRLRHTAGTFSQRPRAVGMEAATARLRAARFRMLNEELYTSGSEHHVRMFSDEKHGEDAWFAYHEAYRAQVKDWPLAPLEVAVAWLRAVVKEMQKQKQKQNAGGDTKTTAVLRAENDKSGKKNAKRKRDGLTAANDAGGSFASSSSAAAASASPASDRCNGGSDEGSDGGMLVVADFGCGDAELGRRMSSEETKRGGGVRVHSFDLVAANESVTKVRGTSLALTATERTHSCADFRRRCRR